MTALPISEAQHLVAVAAVPLWLAWLTSTWLWRKVRIARVRREIRRNIAAMLLLLALILGPLTARVVRADEGDHGTNVPHVCDVYCRSCLDAGLPWIICAWY